MTARPPVSINAFDAHICIWQENAQDPSFRSEVYEGLMRRMKKRGWKFRADPEIARRYRCLSPSHRLGQRGTLHCSIEISGRVVNVEFWSETAAQVNRHGRRYDTDRLRRMHHLDRLRVELEFRRIAAWLTTIAPVTINRHPDRDMPAMARIERSYAESWHKDKDLGRPVCEFDYNRKSASGAFLEHGQTVWFPDRKGRIVRGTAYYNINSMWWVVAGGQLFNESCYRLFTSPPVDLRTKHNERSRRTALEHQLALAVRRMQFQRAEILKRILFGTDPTFMIWARDHNAYTRGGALPEHMEAHEKAKPK